MIDVLRLRTHGVGSDVVDRAFRAVPDVMALSWQECRDVFDRAGGPYSYALSEALAGHGWDVVDLVLDLTPLRDAWVREHGALPPARQERQALALAAIATLEPRVVIDLNLKVFDLQELMELRRTFPFVERTIGIANTMKRLDSALGHDLMLSPSQVLLRLLQRAGGPPGRTFHHAFDPARSTAVTSGARAGAVFTGTVGGGIYTPRRDLLAALLAAGVVEAWIRELDTTSPARAAVRAVDGAAGAPGPGLRSALLGALPLAVLGPLHRRSGRGGAVLDERLRALLGLAGDGSRSTTGRAPALSEQFPERCHGPVFADDMFALLARAQSVVHHELNPSATSLRHFEVTGMGAALVANHVDGLDEVFVPGTEMLTYRDADEAVGILRWLERDPQAAREIGLAGQARTARDHTVSARAGQLSDILHELLGT